MGEEWEHINDAENKNRYILGKKGDNILFCMGINPSTAKPDDLDHTLTVVEKMVGKKGYGGWIMLNLYVITIRYAGDKKPEVILDEDMSEDDPVTVKVFDDILNEEIAIQADLVVLTINTEGEVRTEKLKNMLKVPVDAAGFFIEAHPKIRPLDFSTSGVYLCGAAHYPKNLVDSIAQAEGAASRASIPIMQERMKGEGTVSEVDEELCSGCRTCETVCAYSAIEMKPRSDDPEQFVAVVNKALCKGCGACASACPSGAIDQKGYKINQINVMLEAILEMVA